MKFGCWEFLLVLWPLQLGFWVMDDQTRHTRYWVGPFFQIRKYAYKVGP